MKKRLILSAVALLAALPMAQAAYTPLSITGRAGAYRPNDEDFGKTNLALGLDVKLNITAVPVLGGQTVSLDYMGKNDANLMGVTLVQRFGVPVVSFVKPSPYFGRPRLLSTALEVQRSTSSGCLQWLHGFRFEEQERGGRQGGGWCGPYEGPGCGSQLPPPVFQGHQRSQGGRLHRDGGIPLLIYPRNGAVFNTPARRRNRAVRAFPQSFPQP